MDLLGLDSIQIITVQDNTSAQLDPTELFNWVWCLDRQAKYHYGRSPWVERGYSSAAEVRLLPHGATPPVGVWPIELLDTSDQEGALGYHEDMAFDNMPTTGPKKASGHSSRGSAVHPASNELIPLAKVFVATSEEDGASPLEVASHEMLEMLVDPWVATEARVRKVLNLTNDDFYIVEVGDPVEGEGYDVFAPEGKHAGYTLADFVWPKWFGMEQSRPELSFRNSVSTEFELAPGGYISVAPKSEPENWSQIYGSARAAA